jgi:CRP-like cAMP-binding protein
VTAADLAEDIARFPLFEGIGPQLLRELASTTRLEKAQAGATLVSEGTEGDTLLLLRRGRVRVERRTASNDTYTVRFVDAEAGGFIGELALLDRDVRSATVVAETDCEVIAIDRASFTAFADRNPGAGLVVTRRIARQVGERLRRANEDILTLFTALVQELQERL